MKKPQIGMDIGTYEWKAAVQEGDGTQFFSVQLPENAVDGGCIRHVATVREFLKDVRREQGIPGGECTLILPDSQVYCQYLKMPYMTERQMLLNLPYEFRDYIPRDGDLYYFDYALDRIEKNSGDDAPVMKLTAAAVEKSVVDEYREVFASTGFSLSCVIPREMAYIHLLRRHIARLPRQLMTVAAPNGQGEIQVERPFESCFVDVGQTSTRLHFFSGETFVASRNVEFDCRDIDKAISEMLSVDEFVAGSYKKTNFKDVLNSAECKEVYDNIAIEIMRAVNFYRYNNRDSELKAFYFLGGGANISALCQAAAETSGMEVHYASELAPEVRGPLVNTCMLAYSSLLGEEA